MEIPNLHVTYHTAEKFGGELDFQTAAPILLVDVKHTLRVLMLKVVKSVYKPFAQHITCYGDISL